MNQLATLEPRQSPLSKEDFGKIEALIERNYRLKPKTEGRSMPKVDAEGNIYGWEYQTVEAGLALIPLTQAVDRRLVEAVQRPATRQIIAYHLTRLSAHKRNTRGGFGFQVIVEDACRDLEGCSEWAICKAYDELRRAESPFFPDLVEIEKAVNRYDRAAKAMGQPMEARKPRPVEIETGQEKTLERKRQVAETLHAAGLAHSRQFCGLCAADRARQEEEWG